jgi:hypothetical protein
MAVMSLAGATELLLAREAASWVMRQRQVPSCPSCVKGQLADLPTWSEDDNCCPDCGGTGRRT